MDGRLLYLVPGHRTRGGRRTPPRPARRVGARVAQRGRQLAGTGPEPSGEIGTGLNVDMVGLHAAGAHRSRPEALHLPDVEHERAKRPARARGHGCTDVALRRRVGDERALGFDGRDLIEHAFDSMAPESATSRVTKKTAA